MGLKRALFIRILLAELEDLEQDILHAEERYRNRFEEYKLSQYVYMENRALLEQELSCVKQVLESVRKLDPHAFATVEDVGARVIADLESQVCSYEYPEAVKKLVARKVKKVIQYIRNGVAGPS